MSSDAIQRLEDAQVGSPEMDTLMERALGTGASGSTTSLDLALALAERVLPGHDWSVGHLPTSDDADHEEHHHFGCLFYAHPHVASREDSMAHGATASLAICTAILQAHQSKDQPR